jgi:replicative DNA helicase
MAQNQRILPSNQTVVNLRDLFPEILKELAFPHPSIKLPDWTIFNQLTGGFRMREFSILCGPTGVGKTTLLANISFQLAKADSKHFVMSIETGAKDYGKRYLSIMEGRDLNTGESIDKKLLTEISARHVEILSKDVIEFSLYETRVSIEQLIADIKYAVTLGCKVVFIDNLNFLLKVTRSADQVMEMDNVIHSLIEFVKTLDIHIVMVMHPKKTEGGRVLSEFDIKGSSTSVQEAQNVFLFNPPTAESISKKDCSPQDRELLIRKMRRRGQHVGTTLKFKNFNTLYRQDGYK